MSDSVKTPQEVEAQDQLNAATLISFASKDDLKSGKDGFAPLDENIYKVTVSRAEVRERPNYDDKSVMEMVIMIEFDIDGTKSGDPVMDINGEEQKEGFRKYWEWLNPAATGFRGDGKPSKTRECISALMGTSVEDELPGISVDELYGKSCYAMLEVTSKQDGTKKNKAVKFSKI